MQFADILQRGVTGNPSSHDPGYGEGVLSFSLPVLGPNESINNASGPVLHSKVELEIVCRRSARVAQKWNR